MGVGSFGVIPIPRMVNPAALVAAETWASYVASLNPVLWYRLRETSGTNAANSGSGTGVATISGCTLNQAGQLGAGEAFSWDGADDYIVIANHASFANLSTFEWCFLSNPTNAGENNAGQFFNYNNNYFFEIDNATLRLDFRVNGTTNAVAISSTLMTAGVWQMVNGNYDDAGDRIPNIFINASEVAYATEVAMTGALIPMLVDLYLGNRSALDRTWLGLYDEFILFDYILSPTQRTTMKTLAGL